MTPAFVLTEVVDKRRQTAQFYWLRAPTFLTTYTVYMYQGGGDGACEAALRLARSGGPAAERRPPTRRGGFSKPPVNRLPNGRAGLALSFRDAGPEPVVGAAVGWQERERQPLRFGPSPDSRRRRRVPRDLLGQRQQRFGELSSAPRGAGGGPACWNACRRFS